MWPHCHSRAVVGMAPRRKQVGREESLGVEVYPGFSAAEVLYDDRGGVQQASPQADVGLNKDGSKRVKTTSPGMERARQADFVGRGRARLLAARRSWPSLISRDPQQFGLGVKEVWEVPEVRSRRPSGAFTPSSRIVSRNDGSGWSLLRFTKRGPRRSSGSAMLRAGEVPAGPRATYDRVAPDQ